MANMANFKLNLIANVYGIGGNGCKALAFTARQGHHVASGLRAAADFIDDKSEKADKALTAKAIDLLAKKAATKEIAAMSPEEVKAFYEKETGEVVDAEVVDESKEKKSTMSTMDRMAAAFAAD